MLDENGKEVVQSKWVVTERCEVELVRLRIMSKNTPDGKMGHYL